MGCDIHGVLQVRYDRSYGWRTKEEIDRERNYTLFSILAGVRDCIESSPISEPRGVPSDMDATVEYVKTDYYVTTENEECVPAIAWLGDHSHSHITFAEIYEWTGWTKELREDCKVFLKWMEYIEEKYPNQEKRIVFGFDS